MSRIHDALHRAGQDREKLLCNTIPLPELRLAKVPEQQEEERDTLILPSFTRGEEIQAPQHFYQAPGMRLTLFAVFLIAAASSATVYWNNNARRAVGVADSTVFTGTMQPAAEVKITALVSGVVSRIHAHVGDAVNEGDVLIAMDSHEAEEAVSRAQLAYETAQQNLARLHGELARTEVQASAASQAAARLPSRGVRDSVQHAQTVYEQALTDNQRNEELFKYGIIAKQTLDNSAIALRIAKDDLANAQRSDDANQAVQQLQGQQSDLLSQIGQREQMQQVKEARLALQAASAHLANTTVRATSAGIVSLVPVKMGDQVSVGTPLVVVSRLDRITVNVPVAAGMIASLHKLQQAQVRLPTVPPQNLLGVVRSISPIPSENMTHNVEVEFDNPTGQLLAGQPAEVRFVFE